MNRTQKRQQLVDNYLDFYRLAWVMLRDEQDAKDTVQEAIVRTLTHLGVSDVKAYCFRTVRNIAIDVLRRRLRHRSLDGIDTADNSETDARLMRVAQLRDNLPNDLRDLVVLHHNQGYTYQQLATLTGLSVSTVRRRITEAYDIIKKQLDD